MSDKHKHNSEITCAPSPMLAAGSCASQRELMSAQPVASLGAHPSGATADTVPNGLSARADRVREDAGLVRFASDIGWVPPVGAGQALSADVMRYERLNHFGKAYGNDDDAGDLHEFYNRPPRFGEPV